MTSPYLLPDWLPWWIALILVLIALIYALILLLVPFSVFGIKPRLEAIEEQLQAMQEELRTMALRLPGAPPRSGLYQPAEDLTYVSPPAPPYVAHTVPRPRDNAGEMPARASQTRDIQNRDALDREVLNRAPPSREPLGREPAKPRSTPQRLVGKRIEPRLD